MKLRLILTCIAVIAIAHISATTLPDSLIRRYAAEMLIIGFRGDSLETDPDALHYLKDIRPGGIILFDIDLTSGGGLGTRNIRSREQVAHLTAEMKKAADYPLLIAVDQEGGLVQRLKPRYGYESLPSALHLGTEINNPDSTLHYAEVMAGQLREAGVNMNLAPELDIHRSDCPVIGKLDRAYSSSPDSVALHSGITIRTLADKGIVSVGKHFPGHGSAVSDSHYGLTDVTSTWNEEELIPFKNLIDSGDLKAIMTAHIFNRNIDEELPATLSKKILTGLLREKLGFDGVIITDDMYMKGIIDNYSIEQAIIMAINAGADMMIMGNNINTGYESDRPEKIIGIIANAVKDGKIEESRIIEAHNRIHKLQQSVGF
ncbi:MAG: hypothetical protein K2M07_07195 [Muribaculaceae bacterium]|nr:hypothetical protein [Muribaculaceae bacterium]